jgi:hypothetical protein
MTGCWAEAEAEAWKEEGLGEGEGQGVPRPRRSALEGGEKSRFSTMTMTMRTCSGAKSQQQWRQ